jgi:hypothetical protein
VVETVKFEGAAVAAALDERTYGIYALYSDYAAKDRPFRGTACGLFPYERRRWRPDGWDCGSNVNAV